MRSAALFLSTIWVLQAAAEDFVGTFEQQVPQFIANSQPGDLRTHALEKFEEGRVTLTIDETHLRVEAYGEVIASIPYSIQDRFLLAEGKGDAVWVLYLKDRDTILSSTATFRRIDD